MTSETLDTALDLIEQHLPVFPARHDKAPLTRRGFKDATTDAGQIRKWWEQWPDALVAVPTGATSGLVVIDIDPEGEDWYASHLLDLAPGRVHQTRRGHHLLYQHPANDVAIPSSAGRIAPGVDVRGDGGYAIWHPAQGLPVVGDLEDITPLPKWLKERCYSPKTISSASVTEQRLTETPKIIHEGRRNTTLTSIAGRLRFKGFEVDEIESTLSSLNAKRCQPPLPQAEVHQIARSIGRYEKGRNFNARRSSPNCATHASSGDEHTPSNQDWDSLDLSQGSIHSMLDKPPRRQEFLIKDILPKDIVAVLAGAGSMGKGYATLQLAFSVATGLPWLDMETESPGSVLMLSSEDDAQEIHRRIWKIARYYRENVCKPEEWPKFEGLLKNRLYIIDRTGKDNRLTSKIARQTVRSDFSDSIVREVKKLDEPALVILDPLSRFDGGEPNDNADATKLIEAVEYIRKKTGTTVVLPHHVNKASLRDGDSAQHAVRGASGIVDGARWVGLLYTPKDNAKNRSKYAPKEKRLYFKVVKGNYIKPDTGRWLVRGAGGVLRPEKAETEDTRSTRDREKDDYPICLRRIQDLLHKKGAMPKRRIEDSYGGKDNLLRTGKTRVRNIIKRAIEEGDLILRPDPKSGHQVLDIPHAAENSSRLDGCQPEVLTASC